MQRDYTVLLEYQSVCPCVRIGSPRPLSGKRVCPPFWNQKKVGQHWLAGEGAGVTHFGRLERKPGTLSTHALHCKKGLRFSRP